MDTKIAQALELIRKILDTYRNPAFMCSFGKDSMVLLDLLEANNIRLPIIFHKEPWFPEKYVFADEMIAKYNLEVYDYPPFAMSLWEGKEIMAYMSHYQIGNAAGAILQLPKNILPPVDGKKFICALTDVLARPKGTFSYPWDCVFIGHKNSDKDSIAGKIPLHCDIKINGGIGPDAAFPLRQWTDDDIWDYTIAHNVPYQTNRYDAATRSELPDKSANSDYTHVCIACCDKSNPVKSVHCPKLGYEVSNALPFVTYTSPNFEYFGDKA